LQLRLPSEARSLVLSYFVNGGKHLYLKTYKEERGIRQEVISFTDSYKDAPDFDDLAHRLWESAEVAKKE
jgi:hypothetical protein